MAFIPDPAVYSVTAIWPAGLALTVPKSTTYSGSVVFAPRAGSSIFEMTVTDVDDPWIDHPLSDFDFALTAPFIIAIEISFTLSSAAAVQFDALSYNPTKYNINRSGGRVDAFGTVSAYRAAETYNGFNKIRLEFAEDADNFLGRIDINRDGGSTTTETLVINKIEFIYAAATTAAPPPRPPRTSKEGMPRPELPINRVVRVFIDLGGKGSAEGGGGAFDLSAPPTFFELREDGGYELREDGGYELRDS